ncbi:hypothetical protein Tco_0554488, partial [Tanacetum coccineum]
MHNNIMAAGSRDRPPMLATGRYAQWQSRFLRYIDTRPNGDALRKCILEGPYKLTTITIPAVPTTNDTPAVPEQTAIAIERLQQGESLNIQDVKTNLFWEFGKFTSHAGESMESNASTKFKDKEIAKPITPPSESASEKDNDPEQDQRDKDTQKNLVLIGKDFKKIYKPTKNNLITSSKSINTNVDTSPRYKNDNQTGQFRNQRTMTVVGAKETVDSQEFDHFAKECRKPKRVKDSAYPKEKMLLCKKAEKGVPLQAEQSDWLADTDEEIDEQELEAHHSFMEKIQEVPTADSGTDTEPLEHVQYDPEYNVFANERQHFEQPESISNTCVVGKVNSNVIPDLPDMCSNDIQTDQNAVECDNKRVVLASLIANLKLNVDKNKKIQKKLKKANTSLAHELKECKSILVETSRTLRESNSIGDSFLIALQNKQTELETYKTLNDRTVDYDKLEHDLNVTIDMDQDSVHMVAASKVPMLKPENGNAPLITKVVEGVETTIAPTTAEEKAVEKRFGGNAATKKTKRNLLKQHQFEIHGESISPEDVNQKFLRSLSPEWNIHTIVWRNKPEIDTLSLDDLYNNLKIYEPE